MRININSYSGLDIVRVGSYNETSQSLDFVDSPLPQRAEVLVTGLTYAAWSPTVSLGQDRLS